MEKNAMKPSHLTILLLACLTVSGSAIIQAQHSDQSEGRAATPAEALNLLQEGNKRFVEDRMIHPRQGSARRAEVLRTQRPFAAVLACSDSRVPPEILFDKGIGDLFVVRVAGNIVDDSVTGSLEYAAAHLGVPLIVVLGHTGCGAVTAATQQDEEIRDHVRSLADFIQQALRFTPPNSAVGQEADDPLTVAVRKNVIYGVEVLRASRPTLNRLTAAGKVKVAGAVYHLDSGKVEWLNPAQ